MSRLWDKGVPLDEQVLSFTAGDDPDLDTRLVAYDVRASIAHVTMLQESGYLTAEELTAIRTGLEELAREHESGEWQISVDDEDGHTALETRLTERIGSVGQKIHAGRSRNDQVLAALRLYLRDATGEMGELGESVRAALGRMVAAQGDVPLPGYTHLQRAMPSTVAMWGGAYDSEIADDLAGLERCRIRIERNPLGSAAGFGVPILEIDRARTTELLGFASTQEPVTAVQLSRGKAEAALVFELCLLLRDVGRLAADLCLFATAEFGFVRLPDEFTTGSSIMPQKRNPDVFELVRGRSMQMTSELMAILNVASGLPSGYHRDLQLIKAPLFRALDVCAATLQVMARALPGIRFDVERTGAAMDPQMEATAAAYRLVHEEGVPFREAYRRVAETLRDDDDSPSA